MHERLTNNDGWLLFQSNPSGVVAEICSRHLAPPCYRPIKLFHARFQTASLRQTAAHHSLDYLAGPSQKGYWHFFAQYVL